MKRIALVCIVLLVLVFWVGGYLALFPWQRTQPFTPATPKLSTDAPLSTQTPIVREVVSGLEVPWAMVFTDQDRMLVTERSGRVRVIHQGKLQPDPLHVFSEVRSRSEEGLMGMTLDPAYSENKYIYFCMAVPNGNEYRDRVVRLRDEGTRLSEATILLDGIPAATNHAGCRPKFGPDGTLYVTTGDATDKQIAQDLSSLGGKILRMNADGSIPADNPSPDSYVWSVGHRNPQGLDWHPVSGALIATEHGPSVFDGPAGGDEVNLIEKGKNYGWPIVSHGKHKDGLIDPLVVFTPAVAPASGMFYAADLFPQWKYNYFFGLLRGEGIMRIVFDGVGVAVVSFEKVPGIDVGRIRDIIAGPDGSIYFSTSNRDGRGRVRDGDDKIYQLTAPTLSEEP